jgi:hypothetical protein
MLEPQPLALTDSEMSTIMRAAEPLAPADREDFLRQVATVLGGMSVLGDGVVARTVREIQARYWRPPEINGTNNVGKYGRR